jgi:hypothetical protein
MIEKSVVMRPTSVLHGESPTLPEITESCKVIDPAMRGAGGAYIVVLSPPAVTVPRHAPHLSFVGAGARFGLVYARMHHHTNAAK